MEALLLDRVGKVNDLRRAGVAHERALVGTIEQRGLWRLLLSFRHLCILLLPQRRRLDVVGDLLIILQNQELIIQLLVLDRIC